MSRARTRSLFLHLRTLPIVWFTLGFALHVVYSSYFCGFLLLLGPSSFAWYVVNSIQLISDYFKLLFTVINALWAHHQAHHSNETYSLVNVFRLPFTQEWLYAVRLSHNFFVIHGFFTVCFGVVFLFTHGVGCTAHTLLGPPSVESALSILASHRGHKQNRSVRMDF